MNKKKVIFGIVIFMLLGLFLFTFANPKNDDDNSQNNDIVKPTTNEIKPDETPTAEPTEVVEPTTTTVLEAPRNNQRTNYIRTTQPVQRNVPSVEPTQTEPATVPTTEPEVKPTEPTTEPKTETEVKPAQVYYNVKYLGFKNEVLLNKDVVAGSTVVAPTATDVTLNNVVYTFNGWDKEVGAINSNTVVNAIYNITKITAKIVLDGEEYGTIDLKLDDSLFGAINNPAIVTEDQEVIEGLVDGTLPVSEVQNYKYEYTSLEFVDEVGFVITGSLVIDEEELAKNTVVLTYVINDNAKFADGTKKIETKTTNGYNAVELPKVFVGNKEVHVNWKDTNGELKEGYTSSMTITATIDRNGPVITLKGLVDRTIFETTGSYVEEGFTVTDNYTTFTNDDVNITIKLGNKVVNKVDYSKIGTYTITYTAVDTEGNVGTATRVINVKKVEIDHLELSKTTGTYYIGDPMENITVTAVYNNGDKKVLNRKKCQYMYYYCTDGYTQDKEFDSRTKGNRSIKYTYEGKTATYTYEVIKVEVDHLELSKTTGTYFVGDPMESITVTAVYNTGDRKVLSKQSCSYSRCTDGYTQDKGFDSRTKGNRSIKYTYEGKTATYTYEVIKVEVDHLELSKTTGTYFVGDPMESITVTAVYNTGDRKVLSKQSCSYSRCTDGYTQDKGFDSRTIGTKTIKYTYEGKTATYTYEVKNVEAKGLELSKTTGTYVVGDSMDKIDVYVVYSNGTKEKVTNYSVQGFSTSVENVGNGHVSTISYNGMTAEYKYDVKYRAELVKEEFFFVVTDCHITFDIPDYAGVKAIVFYDANGNAHNIAVNGNKQISISKAEYDMIHAMDGTNANQKLVVTYMVKGEPIVSTYTRVMAK